MFDTERYGFTKRPRNDNVFPLTREEDAVPLPIPHGRPKQIYANARIIIAMNTEARISRVTNSTPQTH